MLTTLLASAPSECIVFCIYDFSDRIPRAALDPFFPDQMLATLYASFSILSGNVFGAHFDYSGLKVEWFYFLRMIGNKSRCYGAAEPCRRSGDGGQIVAALTTSLARAIR
jgi:hypothetical protein